MTKNKRENFNDKTRKILYQRAGGICSNPSCGKMTLDPSLKINKKSTNVGIAAHICAASKNGPRYNDCKTKEERISIENAIWLCASCANLIDKNNGCDYPTEILKVWEKKHEKNIILWLEKGYAPVVDNEKHFAKKLLVNWKQSIL